VGVHAPVTRSEISSHSHDAGVAARGMAREQRLRAPLEEYLKAKALRSDTA
jgi:hypothetical protein